MRRQLVQGDDTIECQAAHLRAAQGVQMAAATEGMADVFAQHADIRALAAHHGQFQERGFVAEELELVDGHRARFALQGDAGPCILI